MAKVTILLRRQMVCILNQRWQRIGKDSADMTTFTPARSEPVNIRKKRCRRRKSTWISVLVADDAFTQCRDMVKFLSYGPKRNIIGIAVMAGFALGRDPHVTEVRCWLERCCRTVAQATILARRQMGSWFSV